MTSCTTPCRANSQYPPLPVLHYYTLRVYRRVFTAHIRSSDGHRHSLLPPSSRLYISDVHSSTSIFHPIYSKPTNASTRPHANTLLSQYGRTPDHDSALLILLNSPPPSRPSLPITANHLPQYYKHNGSRPPRSLP